MSYYVDGAKPLSRAHPTLAPIGEEHLFTSYASLDMSNLLDSYEILHFKCIAIEISLLMALSFSYLQVQD